MSESLLQDVARKMDEAAERWRATAAEQLREGSKSSMCGEEGVPSHVISMARAISFEGAAKTVREALGE